MEPDIQKGIYAGKTYKTKSMDEEFPHYFYIRDGFHFREIRFSGFILRGNKIKPHSYLELRKIRSSELNQEMGRFKNFLNEWFNLKGI